MPERGNRGMTILSLNDGLYPPEPFDSVRACSMRDLEKLRYLQSAHRSFVSLDDNLIRAQRNYGLGIEWLNGEIDVFPCYLPRFDRKKTHPSARPIIHVIDVPRTMFW
jgi:hypothetical protein